MPPFSFVRGQDLTMWDIVWVSPQGPFPSAVKLGDYFFKKLIEKFVSHGFSSGIIVFLQVTVVVAV